MRYTRGGELGDHLPAAAGRQGSADCLSAGARRGARQLVAAEPAGPDHQGGDRAACGGGPAAAGATGADPVTRRRCRFGQYQPRPGGGREGFHPGKQQTAAYDLAHSDAPPWRPSPTCPRPIGRGAGPRRMRVCATLVSSRADPTFERPRRISAAHPSSRMLWRGRRAAAVEKGRGP